MRHVKSTHFEDLRPPEAELVVSRSVELVLRHRFHGPPRACCLLAVEFVHLSRNKNKNRTKDVVHVRRTAASAHRNNSTGVSVERVAARIRGVPMRSPSRSGRNSKSYREICTSLLVAPTTIEVQNGRSNLISLSLKITRKFTRNRRVLRRAFNENTASVELLSYLPLNAIENWPVQKKLGTTFRWRTATLPALRSRAMW